mmetsp:Transcript_2732/g.5004  ORF Transcript_2732/g.5004 Transcript_2732/m.5004 type:complete len:124 (+) Transcript_2732:522-893(+)
MSTVEENELAGHMTAGQVVVLVVVVLVVVDTCDGFEGFLPNGTAAVFVLGGHVKEHARDCCKMLNSGHTQILQGLFHILGFRFTQGAKSYGAFTHEAIKEIGVRITMKIATLDRLSVTLSKMS